MKRTHWVLTAELQNTFGRPDAVVVTIPIRYADILAPTQQVVPSFRIMPGAWSQAPTGGLPNQAPQIANQRYDVKKSARTCRVIPLCRPVSHPRLGI
ncbi:hypothetical protein KL907_003133 [Ogataea polymorpha]|nr:hypothetical protein KL907_003133 [Ogataea polymorpha]